MERSSKSILVSSRPLPNKKSQLISKYAWETTGGSISFWINGYPQVKMTRVFTSFISFITLKIYSVMHTRSDTSGYTTKVQHLNTQSTGVQDFLKFIRYVYTQQLLLYPKYSRISPFRLWDASFSLLLASCLFICRPRLCKYKYCIRWRAWAPFGRYWRLQWWRIQGRCNAV